MKLLRTYKQSESGSVLATTLAITFVIGATLASFLLLAQHQIVANTRSQSWNHSLAVTEAAVEDALQMINKYSHTPNLVLEWANDIDAGGAKADSWVYLGNNMYKATRTIGDPVRARYEVLVNNNDPLAPTIRAKGFLQYDYGYEAGTPIVNIASVGTTARRYKTTELERTILVETRRDPLWSSAMLADVFIDFNGNGVSTDSFNSADRSASYWAADATFGIYDPAMANDEGDVACNGTIVDSLRIGNASIKGHASTGPGGTCEIGARGSIGSAAWVDGGNTGVETGYLSDDMNIQMNDVSLPTTTWFPLPDVGKKAVTINGKHYKHVILFDGDYKASTLKGSVYVAPGVDARLYLKDNVMLAGNDGITLDPAAKRLTVYMEGSEFKVMGGGVSNETGNAAAFQYYGLPTNTAIAFGGNAGFTGAIYANHADFSMGGGGNNIYGFTGACVVRSVTMNGHFAFHYDENLVNYGPSRGFIPTRWAEL